MAFAAGEDQNEADQIPKSGKKSTVKKKKNLQKRERAGKTNLTVSGHPLSVRLLP